MSGETSENRPRYCVGRALDLWPSLSISAGSISAGDLPADTHEKKNNREIYTPHKHRGISRQHCIEVVQDEYNDGYTQLYIQALNGRLEERKKKRKKVLTNETAWETPAVARAWRTTSIRIWLEWVASWPPFSNNPLADAMASAATYARRTSYWVISQMNQRDGRYAISAPFSFKRWFQL